MQESKIFSAVNAMIKTDRMHKQLLDSTVSSIGLHRTHHRILMHVAMTNRLSSQKELAEHIGITPAAITGALKKLEKEGYIKRIRGCDNRYNQIEITEHGRKIVEDTKALFTAVDTSLFAGFSDSELDGYIEILEKIQANIRRQLPSVSESGCNKKL